MSTSRRRPPSDLQRLRLAARDGDHEALVPLADACEEAGDAETAAVARGLFALITRWHHDIGPDGTAGQEGAEGPPLLASVLVTADGHSSVATFHAARGAHQFTTHAVSLTSSSSPDPALAALLRSFDRYRDLAEGAGRALDLPVVQLFHSNDQLFLTNDTRRDVTLRPGRHLPSLRGAQVKQLLYGR